MNNCCDNAYQDGGTINAPQILNPEIVGGILKGVSLTDGVKLDETTAIDLANQLCPKLNQCIQQAVNGGSFHQLTLEDITFRGPLSFDVEAATNIVSAICAHMTDCVIGIIKSNVIDAVNLTNLHVTDLMIDGNVSLDNDAAKDIAHAVSAWLDDYVISVVENNPLKGVIIDDLVLNAADITGNILLDETASKAIAEQVRHHLDDYIVDVINSTTLNNQKLSNAVIDGVKLSGQIEMDADVKAALVDVITSAVLEKQKLNNAIINGLDLTGKVTLDATAAKDIADGIADYLGDHIRDAVLSGVLDSIKLSNASIAGLALTGAVTVDDTAAKALSEALCPYLETCILNALKSNVLTGLTLDKPTITGALGLDKDAAASIHDAISDAITEQVGKLVNQALTDGTLCCLNIKGAEINNSSGSNNTWTDTTLAGKTTITGELILGDDAISNLCSALTPCIDDRFAELMEKLGRVYVDGETIGGDGTVNRPLHALFDTDVDSRLLPTETTQSELPTTIIGSREKLLGGPDYFVKIGGHILPAWKG